MKQSVLPLYCLKTLHYQPASGSQPQGSWALFSYFGLSERTEENQIVVGCTQECVWGQ